MFLDPRSLDLLRNELVTDLFRFLPELLLCAGIVVLLFLRLFSFLNRYHLGNLAFLFTALALLAAWDQWTLSNWDQPNPTEEIVPAELFTSMLAYDSLGVFMRLFLLGFTAFTIVLSLLTGLPDTEDSADFYVLLLGATLGMCLMATANHLLMVYIGVEMASLPSYALAGFLKGRRQSSEAALKYVVYGGGASGIMLYGISLLAGRFGSGSIPAVAYGMLTTAAHPSGLAYDLIPALGLLFLLVGLGFKLAAVPFHFWCPDVFEGASAEVAGFLSVASKGAALALLARICLSVGGVATVFDFRWNDISTTGIYLIPALAFFSGLTATFGNLAAYRQNNLKRLLAYSTIAHAGYMMMGITALTASGASAVLFYLIIYFFMNLGAFAVVAFIRNLTGSEDLRDYRGLILRAPLLVITLGVFLLSLLGIPPLGGFVAKFQILRVLFDAGRTNMLISPMLGYSLYALVVVAGLNTALSAFYYLRVLKIMVLERPVDLPDGMEPTPLRLPLGASTYAAVLALLVIVTGIFFNPLAVASERGAQTFGSRKPQASGRSQQTGTIQSGNRQVGPPQ